MRIGALAGWPFALVAVARAAVGRQRFEARLRAAHAGLKLGRDVEVRGPQNLRLGRDVQIDKGVLLHCGGLEWSEGKGLIAIGDGSYVGPNCVLFGAGEIHIGARVLISPGVVIASHQHTFARGDIPMGDQPTEFSPVRIEDNVWIGSNATILPGVRLGRGAIIGAGAVVTRDVEPNQMALGVPARAVKTL